MGTLGLRDGWFRVQELEPLKGFAKADPDTQEAFVPAGQGHTFVFRNQPLSAICVWKYDRQHPNLLDDLDYRPFMVLEVRRVIPVGVQRHQLAGGILQPGGGYGFLGDLIDAGQEVFQLGTACGVRLNLIHGMAVCGADSKNRIGDGRSQAQRGGSVRLYELQKALIASAENQFGRLPVGGRFLHSSSVTTAAPAGSLDRSMVPSSSVVISTGPQLPSTASNLNFAFLGGNGHIERSHFEH